MTEALRFADDSRQFVLLAPPGAKIPGAFRAIAYDSKRHERLFGEMQRLRGEIYLDDGAIKPLDLDSSGRHRMSGDEESWHILRLGSDGSVSGCARILVHRGNVVFPKLRLASSALARCAEWSSHLRAAVENELTYARQSSLTLVEPGGWALVPDLRGSMEALCIAVSAFAWTQIVGGCLGFITATVRHGSSSILRRLGGASLRSGNLTLPTYFDPAYGCDMELLRFDSESLSPRYEPALVRSRSILLSAPVICGEVMSHQLAQTAAA